MVPQDLPDLMQIDAMIESKANKGVGEALFSYGKELYQYINNGDPTVSKQHLD